MHGIHTHYDNLKVSRDAHPKIIRAAYKKLSRQYHPDHNPNNPEATKVMQVINLAYDVLSDPEKRKEHDEWIARMEAERQPPPPYPHEPHFEYAERNAFHFRHMDMPSFYETAGNRTEPRQQHGNSPATNINKKAIGEHIIKHWFWYVLTIAVVIGFGYHSYSKNSYSPFVGTSQQHQSYPRLVNGKQQPGAISDSTAETAIRHTRNLPQNGHYARPATAPDGYPWPKTAAYLIGVEHANSSGLSSVTVDNAVNEADVLVKLFNLDGERPHAVRVFYIPAHASFKAEKLNPGLYDLRYHDLQNGLLYRSEPFELQESTLANGVRYTGISMTLNSIAGGKAPMLNLAQEDF